MAKTSAEKALFKKYVVSEPCQVFVKVVTALFSVQVQAQDSANNSQKRFDEKGKVAVEYPSIRNLTGHQEKCFE